MEKMVTVVWLNDVDVPAGPVRAVLRVGRFAAKAAEPVLQVQWGWKERSIMKYWNKTYNIAIMIHIELIRNVNLQFALPLRDQISLSKWTTCGMQIFAVVRCCTWWAGSVAWIRYDLKFVTLDARLRKGTNFHAGNFPLITRPQLDVSLPLFFTGEVWYLSTTKGFIESWSDVFSVADNMMRIIGRHQHLRQMGDAHSQAPDWLALPFRCQGRLEFTFVYNRVEPLKMPWRFKMFSCFPPYKRIQQVGFRISKQPLNLAWLATKDNQDINIGTNMDWTV